jgi:hypothetical protein
MFTFVIQYKLMINPEQAHQPESDTFPVYLLQSIIDQQLQLHDAMLSLIDEESSGAELRKYRAQERKACIEEMVHILNGLSIQVSATLDPESENRTIDLSQNVEVSVVEQLLNYFGMKLASLSNRRNQTQEEGDKRTRNQINAGIAETSDFIKDLAMSMEGAGLEVRGKFDIT